MFPPNIRFPKCIPLAPLAGAALLASSFAAQAQIAAWEIGGVLGSDPPAPLAPVEADENVSVSDIFRGPGINPTGANNSWGANGWDGPTDTASAVAAGKYVTFSIQPNAGYELSFSEIGAYNIRRSATGPTTGQWQFSIGGGSFVDIGTPITWGTVTAAGGNPQTAIDLSGIETLQNLPPHSEVTFRVVNYGASGSGGTWYFNNISAGLDLVINGSTAPAGPDEDSPEIANLSPADGAVNVPVDTQLIITFNEPIVAGTGTVELHDAGGLVESFPATGSVSGNTAAFTPGAPLDTATEYHVLISNDAFLDHSENAFAGISSPGEWSFTTVEPDLDGPVPVAFSPENGATNVSVNEELLWIAFDEEVFPAETGEIRIVRIDGTPESPVYTTVQTIEATWIFPEVEPNEVIVFLDPGQPLEHGKTYYIEADEGLFLDAFDNESAAFGTPETWSFRTETLALLTSSGPYTEDFEDFATTADTLPEGWKLVGAVTGFFEPEEGDEEDHYTWGAGFRAGLRGDASVLGYQHTGNTGTLLKVLTLRNDTGAEITDLTISYTGRAERTDQSRSPAYEVALKPNVSGFDTIPVPNLGYSTGDGDEVGKIASVNGLSIAEGAIFQIIWTSDRGAGSDASKQIGISDVSVGIGSSLFPPSVAGITVIPEELGALSASVSAEINADGGAAVTQHGFVFSETAVNSSPETGGTGVTTISFGAAGTGSFSGTLESLSPETSYTVRAFATNSEGTSYTGGATFTTLALPPAFTGYYSQPFNDFAGLLPVGWTAVSSGGIHNYAGAWGSGTAGGFRGGAASPGVIGYQHTGTTGLLTVTLSLVNDTGGTLDSLYIGYLGRVARADQERTPAWAVTVNGEPVEALAYSTASGSDQNVSTQLTDLGIPDGAVFTIRWVSDRGLNSNGSSRQIGIGNVIVATEAPSNTYASWIAGFDVGGQTALDDDADNDGIPNAVENFFGTDPSAFNSGLTVISTSPDSLVFEHPVSDNFASDLTASYEWSVDLVNWTASGGTLGGTTVTFASDVSAGTATVTATTIGTPAAKLFVRVKVQ